MRGLISLAAVLLAASAHAQDKPAKAPSPGEIVSAAPHADWREIAPDDLLVIDLAPDASGGKREVVIQLIPPPFSQGWVDNIRTLAKDHWWDGTNVYRVQDNYVVQWGGGAIEKEDPKGLKVVPESNYAADLPNPGWRPNYCLRVALDGSCPEFVKVKGPTAATGRDPYAANTGFYSGWPIGFDWRSAGPAGKHKGKAVTPLQLAGWPLHCYGMVGVARGTDNTGSGSDLYTVIGQAPRQLDRNIALVGRVIEGMEFLSSLPRGHGQLGFYDDDEAARRVPIVSVRLASELDAQDRPRFEYLSTESKSFADYVHARANRHDEFFKVPAGGIDLCNVAVPVRRILER